MVIVPKRLLRHVLIAVVVLVSVIAPAAAPMVSAAVQVNPGNQQLPDISISSWTWYVNTPCVYTVYPNGCAQAVPRWQWQIQRGNEWGYYWVPPPGRPAPGQVTPPGGKPNASQVRSCLDPYGNMFNQAVGEAHLQIVGGWMMGLSVDRPPWVSGGSPNTYP